MAPPKIFAILTEVLQRIMKQNTLCSNPREAFSNVMINIMKDNEDYNNLTCLKGHLFQEQTFKTMTRSLFNVFTSNYVREISSEIHQHKATKSKVFTGTRSQNRCKIKKLTGTV